MAQPCGPQQLQKTRTLTSPPASRVRSGLIMVALTSLTVGMFGLSVRVACLSGGYVKGPDGSSLHDVYQTQNTVKIRLPARRGNIFDCTGRLLAGSLEVPSIFADPSLIQDIEATATTLQDLVGQQAGEIATDLASRRHRKFTWIQRQVADEQAAAVKALRLAGIGVRDEPVRIYPMGSVAAHVLGFVGTEQKGLAGLELVYDKYLRGQDGYKICLRSASKKILGLAPGGYKPPRDGCSIVLSIDSYIQTVAEQALQEAVTTYEAQGGVAIVTEPSTGQVLALASYPTFDPNYFRQAPESALLNRALTGPVEPGSIFKPLVMSAAIQEAAVRPGEIIYCHNGLYVKGSRRLRDVHPYSNLTVEQVIAKSSNIGMAQIGERLGNYLMHHYLTQFGLGAKTGIDLPGEDVGILLPIRRWTSFSTNSVPMGQEISVTSIQMLTAFNAIVNGGNLVTPTVVRAVLNPDGSVLLDRREPKVVHRVLDESVARYMTQGPLKATINEGTGTRAKLARWQVVGKTGTAQIARRGGGGYEPDAYVASFICAAPASDPRVSVAVMVHRPNKRKGYYGGTVSCRPAAKILAAALDYLGVPDDPIPPAADGPMLVSAPVAD